MPVYRLGDLDPRFSKRFYALRAFFHVSTRDLGKLLNYKSASAITNFEKIPVTNYPSMQALIRIHQLYGVSIDWLIGISETPFTEGTIAEAEDKLLLRLTPSSFTSSLWNNTPELKLYNQIQETLIALRNKKCLVLSDRFTLIFLLNYMYWDVTNGYTNWKMNTPNLPPYKILKPLYSGKDTSMFPYAIRKHEDYIPAFFRLKKALEEGIVQVEPVQDLDFSAFVKKYQL